MKTTIHIPDALFRQAKAWAHNEGITLRELMEAALRRFLESHRPGKGGRPLRRHTFRGKGLKPGVTASEWREMAHEDRG